MSSCCIFEMKTKWPSLANPLSPSPPPSLLPHLTLLPASSAKRLEFVCQPFAAATTVATRRPLPINGSDWRAETTSQKPRWERETRSLCVCGVPVQEFSYVFATYNMQHAATSCSNTCGTYTRPCSNPFSLFVKKACSATFAFAPKKKQ